MCEEIGARLIIEEEVPSWAEHIADLVKPRIVSSDLRMAQA